MKIAQFLEFSFWFLGVTWPWRVPVGLSVIVRWFCDAARARKAWCFGCCVCVCCVIVFARSIPRFPWLSGGCRKKKSRAVWLLNTLLLEETNYPWCSVYCLYLLESGVEFLCIWNVGRGGSVSLYIHVFLENSSPRRAAALLTARCLVCGLCVWVCVVLGLFKGLTTWLDGGRGEWNSSLDWNGHRIVHQRSNQRSRRPATGSSRGRYGGLHVALWM